MVGLAWPMWHAQWVRGWKISEKNGMEHLRNNKMRRIEIVLEH